MVRNVDRRDVSEKIMTQYVFLTKSCAEIVSERYVCIHVLKRERGRSDANRHTLGKHRELSNLTSTSCKMFYSEAIPGPPFYISLEIELRVDVLQ